MTQPTIDATADLELHVPRGGDGSLQDGITTVLCRSAAVDRTEIVEITGVTPTLNDLRVTVSVRLYVHADEADDEDDAVRSAVVDQFGVQSVEACEVHGVLAE
ncbi:hypothetical protein [Halorussus halophilus]|uniref:hypothetical protein n=1 Tax=Halorussus halophilus TaxID=2650975 RepID=UPI0013014DC4|nr:hypothetical protein [Halorussus halophilus]